MLSSGWSSKAAAPFSQEHIAIQSSYLWHPKTSTNRNGFSSQYSMEYLLSRSENECELLRAVTVSMVLAWPSFSFLQVPPTAGLPHSLEHPDTLNTHSWPGHSWLRLKLKIISNTQLRNTLDGVLHWTKAIQRSAGIKIPLDSVTATWFAAAQLGNSTGAVEGALILSLPCTALLYFQLHPSLP